MWGKKLMSKPERELLFRSKSRATKPRMTHNNYLNYLAYMAEVAKEEGTLDRLPVQPNDINNKASNPGIPTAGAAVATTQLCPAVATTQLCPQLNRLQWRLNPRDAFFKTY
jgi:fumarate hydratase class II